LSNIDIRVDSIDLDLDGMVHGSRHGSWSCCDEGESLKSRGLMKMKPSRHFQCFPAIFFTAAFYQFLTPDVRGYEPV